MQSFKADELPENPSESATPISIGMFCFTVSTFFKGRKKVLDESDLYRALKEHKSDRAHFHYGVSKVQNAETNLETLNDTILSFDWANVDSTTMLLREASYSFSKYTEEELDKQVLDYVGELLSQSWEEEVSKSRAKGKEPSLLQATFKVFGLNYLMLGILLFIYEICLRCSQPLFLGALVAFYANPESDKADQTDAYLYAIGVIMTSAGGVCCWHPSAVAIGHCGMKMRVAICSLIYRKALRLSKTALGDTTSGQVVNLISNDVSRLDTAAWHTHYLWIAPLELMVVIYLMYREIGVSAFVGVVITLMYIPLQGFLGKKISDLRLRTALCTDERIRMMSEIISGIQVIKMYAWEIPFSKMVAYARAKEMKAIRYANYIRSIMSSFLMYITRISIFSSLVILVVLGHFLTAEKAFVITAFYNCLRNCMSIYLPMAIIHASETIVSFKRIQKFMLLDETKILEPEQISKIHPTANINGIEKISVTSKEPTVVIKNLKAKWNNDSLENTLDDVTLEFKPKQLVAVIGPVGAGKSTLIQTILGELPAASGSIKVNGTISYASQEPWLFTGTVRQNILFGQPMDRRRYNITIKKCALERDFELLPYGDKTIVGERGASLSGGQKARINLARAVYRQADIYLLDDPLSAVDPHVGRHLFDQCMRRYLREHTVILVTHQLQFLEEADLIVILDKGHLRAMGTFESMRKSGIDYAKMLTHNKIVDEEEEIKRRNSKFRQRQISIVSMASTVESLDLNDSPMQSQEFREEGKIDFKLYKQYFGSSGSCFILVSLAFFCVGAQILASGSDYFLSYWTNKNQHKLEVTDIQIDYEDIYIIVGLTAAVVIFAVVRSMLFCNVAMKSSTNLHNRMFMAVTRSAMHFFNTNPTGRVMNRFSKDMGQVDEILPLVMIDVMQIFLGLLGILVVLCFVNPWYILVTAVLVVVFYFLRSFYLKTSRDVKRLEAITRSPIYTHLGASLNGLSTIRAFKAEKILIEEFDNYQDLHSSAFYMFLTTSRSFGFWLDCCCVIYISIITISFFLFHPENGGDVGLAITQALGMTGLVQYGMRQSAELENTMTSVERVVEYEDIKPEGEFEAKPEQKPPKSWPEEGYIKFNDLSLRYFPDPESEYVLKALNFEIKPCEKVGIVGRTGAGKSSLINALFRLSYNDGSVLIDRRDINEMGLHDLRAKISIIPQDPVLFSGTMRYNLDPFDEYSDAKLWEALSEVKLKEVVKEMPSGLESKIAEGGTNFSVGQRQLVCLARAILRENRILVLDEATANVDPQTDAVIQTTIRHKFHNCTVLTIAHRLHTVMDSDKVLVMDAGRAVEFGSPYELLTKSPSKFHGMVKQLGDATFESLFKVAQKAHVDIEYL